MNSIAERFKRYLKGPVSELTDKQRFEINSDVCQTNWKRLRVFMGFTLFFEILLVILIDVPTISSAAPSQAWLAVSYLVLHTIIGATALVSFILYSIFLNRRLDQKIQTDLPSLLINLIILVCLSLITGLDQIKIGDISVFVINLLVCGVLVMLPLRQSFFLYSIPFAVLVAGLFVFQPNVADRNAHIINGGIFWVAVLIISKFVYDNHVSHVYKNIKLEEANRKLQILSTHDPLTNLSNRRNFELQVQIELALVRRYNQQSWLILSDIDHFKSINDQYGHAIGDRVLVEVAGLLQQNIRNIDLACRWGGEEFLMLITHSDRDTVKMVAERLCRELAYTPIIIDGQELTVTASFGVARLKADSNQENEFLTSYQSADRALYSAKQSGRNRVILEA